MSVNPTNAKANSLLDKNVSVEPTGVIYNLRGSHVEDFAESYLVKRNIEGVEKVSVVAKREGPNRPELAVYLFIDSRSKFINSSAKEIPVNLRNKLDHIHIELSEDLKKVLYPLCGKEIKCGKTERGMCYVRLDIFRILALMLAVDHTQHNINIPSVTTIPQSNEPIFNVIKELKYRNKNGSNKADFYDNLVKNLENR